MWGKLLIERAQLITQFESEVDDYPEHIVANRPGMAGTVLKCWALSRRPGGVPVVPEFTRTMRFGFHSLRWQLQSQACLV